MISMLKNRDILRNVYFLERVDAVELEGDGWILRGRFILRSDIDEIKRFMYFKRHIDGLSFSGFKAYAFLKPTIIIDVQVQRFSKEDAERIKGHLWYKLHSYISNKLHEHHQAIAT